MSLISIVILIPLLGALVIALVPRRYERALKWIALVSVLVNFAFSIALFAGFRGDTANMQFVERAPWIPQLGIAW